MVFKKQKKGFTLIEVLVSLSIVVFMAALVLPRYTLMQKRASLLQDSYHLSESIREAQEMAVSGKRVGGSWPDGYGVYLIEGGENYIIYADMNDDKTYSAIHDSIIKTIDLQANIEVKTLPGGGPFYINFSPPDPVTDIKAGPAALSEALIVLGAKNTSYEGQVYINAAGLTSVD